GGGAGRGCEEEGLGGVVHEAHGEAGPPLHPAGVRPHGPIGRTPEIDPLEYLIDAPPQLPAGDAVELALQHEVLAPGRLFGRTRPLADDADRAPNPLRLCQDVDSGDTRLAVVGP